jgi:hypothetical protein
MGTTSAESALALLKALEAANVDYALLHGASSFNDDSISDVDLAVSSFDIKRLALFLQTAQDCGYQPLVAWQYDLRAITTFFMTSDFREGVQLDILADPHGYSRHGIRTDVLVQTSYVDRGIRQAEPLDSWLYQISKRWLKGQDRELEMLLATRKWDIAAVVTRAQELFRTDRAAEVSALIGGYRPSVRQPISWHCRNIVRIAGRLRRPCGAWFHLEGQISAHAAELLADRLETVLLRASAHGVTRRQLAIRLGLFGSMGLDRWKATGLVTFGVAPLLRTPSRITCGEEVGACQRIPLLILRNFAAQVEHDELRGKRDG